MTPQEQDIIGRFIARVGGGASASSVGASVPATRTSLPPIDPQADRFIADQFSTHPEARYRVTQMAFVQEAALAEAQNRIKQLEYQLGQVNQQLQQAQQAQPSGGRGLFGGLFGGGSQSQPRYAPPPQYAPPPAASYPPGYQPGMFGSGGGSGFLGSALTTAAGVAGGVLAADAITSMFSPHNYGGFGGGGFGGGGFGGGGFGGGEVINETTVNNFGPQDAGAGDPWGGAGTSDPGSGGDAWSGTGQADGGGGDWAGGGSDSGGGDSGGWDDSGGSSDDSSF